jgi:superfamily I DNA/RNA helicase
MSALSLVIDLNAVIPRSCEQNLTHMVDCIESEDIESVDVNVDNPCVHTDNKMDSRLSTSQNAIVYTILHKYTDHVFIHARAGSGKTRVATVLTTMLTQMGESVRLMSFTNIARQALVTQLVCTLNLDVGDGEVILDNASCILADNYGIYTSTFHQHAGNISVSYNNSMDTRLSDAITHATQCIRSNPSVYKTFFDVDYVIIDEMQDTNKEQIEFLVELQKSVECRFIFLGDVAQGIYKFRNADCSTLVDVGKFEQLGIGSYAILPMSETFRCSRYIAACANDILRYVLHYDESLLMSTESTDMHIEESSCERPILTHFDNMLDECVYILEMYRVYCVDRDTPMGSFVVITRTKYQAASVRNCLQHIVGDQCLVRLSYDTSTHGNKYLNVTHIHALKGGEADVVYIVGAGDHNFPLTRSASIHEECCIFYTIISRARHMLIISTSGNQLLTPFIRRESLHLYSGKPSESTMLRYSQLDKMYNIYGKYDFIKLKQLSQQSSNLYEYGMYLNVHKITEDRCLSRVNLSQYDVHGNEYTTDEQISTDHLKIPPLILDGVLPSVLDTLSDVVVKNVIHALFRSMDVHFSSHLFEFDFCDILNKFAIPEVPFLHGMVGLGDSDVEKLDDHCMYKIAANNPGHYDLMNCVQCLCATLGLSVREWSTIVHLFHTRIPLKSTGFPGVSRTRMKCEIEHEQKAAMFYKHMSLGNIFEYNGTSFELNQTPLLIDYIIHASLFGIEHISTQLIYQLQTETSEPHRLSIETLRMYVRSTSERLIPRVTVWYDLMRKHNTFGVNPPHNMLSTSRRFMPVPTVRVQPYTQSIERVYQLRQRPTMWVKDIGPLFVNADTNLVGLGVEEIYSGLLGSIMISLSVDKGTLTYSNVEPVRLIRGVKMVRH